MVKSLRISNKRKLPVERHSKLSILLEPENVSNKKHSSESDEEQIYKKENMNITAKLMQNLNIEFHANHNNHKDSKGKYDDLKMTKKETLHRGTQKQKTASSQTFTRQKIIGRRLNHHRKSSIDRAFDRAFGELIRSSPSAKKMDKQFTGGIFFGQDEQEAREEMIPLIGNDNEKKWSEKTCDGSEEAEMLLGEEKEEEEKEEEKEEQPQTFDEEEDSQMLVVEEEQPETLAQDINNARTHRRTATADRCGAGQERLSYYHAENIGSMDTDSSIAGQAHGAPLRTRDDPSSTAALVGTMGHNYYGIGASLSSE